MNELIYKVQNRELVLQSTRNIFSGSENADSIRVFFDEEWDGFEKHAVFDVSGVRYEVVMDNDRVLLPPVVTERSGRASFGVYGKSGDVVLSSSMASLPVRKGTGVSEHVAEADTQTTLSLIRSLEATKVDGARVEAGNLYLQACGIDVAGPLGPFGTGGAGGGDGRGIADITQYWARTAVSTSTPSKSTMTTTPVLPTANNRYLYTYLKFTFTDGTTEDSPIWMAGAWGNNGTAGTNGRGITSVAQYWARTAISTATPDKSTMTTTPVLPTANNRYLYTYLKFTYSDGTTEDSPIWMAGAWGNNGTAGAAGADGAEGGYYTPSVSGTTISWTPSKLTMPSVPDSTIEVAGGGTGKDGADGAGIASVESQYCRASSSTTAAGTWAASPATLTTTYRYQWQRFKITDTNDTITYTTPWISAYYISASTPVMYYLRTASSTGVTSTTSGWSTTRSEPTSIYPYVWMKATYTLYYGTTSSTQTLGPWLAERYVEPSTGTGDGKDLVLSVDVCGTVSGYTGTDVLEAVQAGKLPTVYDGSSYSKVILVTPTTVSGGDALRLYYYKMSSCSMPYMDSCVVRI